MYVSTCLTGKLFNNGVERGFFDSVFVDEAGHALEPEAVAPLACLLNSRPLDTASSGSSVISSNARARIVLAGDPKQLGPIVMASQSKDYGLQCSLLERLIQRKVYQKDRGIEEQSHDSMIARLVNMFKMLRPVSKTANADTSSAKQVYDPRVLTKLVLNYRSHPDILRLPNTLFYDGDLIPAAERGVSHNLEDWEHLPTPGVPMIFHGVEGKDDREGSSPSWFNADEAAQVLAYVKLLLLQTKRNRVQAQDIGIISPYNKQVQKIRQLLKSEDNDELNKIKVASTELFQVRLLDH